MWDNRGNKKNAKAPDFRCKNKECKDDEGFTTGVWVKDLKKNTARAQRHEPKPVPTVAGGGFDQMPEALDEDDDLPF